MTTSRHIFPTLALLLAATGLAAQTPDTLSYTPAMLPTVYYTDGLRNLSSGDVAKARECFELAIAQAELQDSDHGPSQFELARILVAQADGDLSAALACNGRALASDPGNIWYKKQRGALLVGMDLYAEAIEVYKTLADPSVKFDMESYRMLSLLYYRQKQLDAALTTLEKAAERSGKSAEIVELQRAMLIESGRVDEAISLTERYVAATPYDEDNRIVLAEMYDYMGRPDDRKKMLEEVLAIDPDNARAREMLSPGKKQPADTVEEMILGGDLYGALSLCKSMPEAIKIFSKVAKKITDDPTGELRSEIYSIIGELWHQQGNSKKTFSAYDNALRHNPDNAAVLNNYAYFLAEEGRDLYRALGMASRAIKLVENDPTTLDTYAWVLYKLGNYAEAKKVMQAALPLDRTGSPVLLIHYGDILHALGDEFMASQYWKKARDAGYEPASDIEQRLSTVER